MAKGCSHSYLDFQKKEETERKNNGHSVDVISETVIVDSHINSSTIEQIDDLLNHDGLVN